MALIEELKEITNGIYVLTVHQGEIRHGMSSSWVTQVSGEPPLVMASIDRRHFSHGLVRAARRFGLNVVGRGGRSLEDFFYSPAAKAENNLARFATIDAPSGVPLLADALAGFDCAVVDERTAGDHTLFVGQVEWVRRGRADSPLTTLDLEYVYLGTGRIVKR
ncbi:MAG: flavin reductase family protein [Candidatus Binatia bacterium]